MDYEEIAEELVDCLTLSLQAFNLQPRFKVRDTNSYEIASRIEKVLAQAVVRGPGPAEPARYPFNLDRALNGEPVVNKWGEPVMDIRFVSHPITGRIESASSRVYTYTLTGKAHNANTDSDDDLFMTTPAPAEPPAPTHQVDPDCSNKLKLLFDLIDQERFDDARAVIADLECSLGSDEPELTRARSLIHFLESPDPPAPTHWVNLYNDRSDGVRRLHPSRESADKVAGPGRIACIPIHLPAESNQRQFTSEPHDQQHKN